MSKFNIAVIGGGIAGLSVAFRLTKLGHNVTIYDPATATGASYAAAGMLAPASEVNFSEIPLLRLMQKSGEMWKSFASEIESISGLDIGYRTEGTLLVGFDQNDASEFKRICEFQREFGIEVTQLSRSQIRELEPNLNPSISFASLIKGDHQVDNRELLKALITSLDKFGVEIVNSLVVGIHMNTNNRYSFSLQNGKQLESDILILSPGAMIHTISGLPREISTSIRPVKGQIIRVISKDRNFLRHVLRAKVANQSVYLVPRNTGEIVIGATQEEVGFDDTAKVRPIAELLTNACRIVPAIGESHFEEQVVRYRPGSIDNAPIIGRYDNSNLYLSLGHFRHGILLSAALSHYLAQAIDSGKEPLEIMEFGPMRLSKQ